MKKIKIEVCSYNIESAISAKNAGADRIELCDNFQEGGTTPSIGTIKCVRKKTNIDLFVIIRPRGGDFLYSENEYEVIKEDIKSAKRLGVNGIVSGFLTANGSIDLQRTSEIVELSHPLPFTFHRAFDYTKDPFDSIELLKKAGVTRVLTSGQKKNVEEGISFIKLLMPLAGDDITIIPGGGINSANVLKIIRETGVKEIHLSGKRLFNSNMEYFKEGVPLNINLDLPDNKILKTDQNIINEIINKLTTG